MVGELVTTEDEALASKPDFVESESFGTENIGKDDVLMPRLALAQAQSPQLIEGDPKFVEGLGIGHLFNSLTDTVYGKGPVDFSVIRVDPPRGIEFLPLEEGGGIKDFDVALNDPRMQWDGDKKPVATKFYDFIVMLWPSQEVIVLSLKSSGLKVARKLNALIQCRAAPVYSGKYTLTTSMAKGPAGSYATYVVKNNGWVDKKQYALTRASFDALKDKVIDVERVAGEDNESEPPF